jgi:enoyl-CoA hydratase/carnithine racemase
VQALNLLLSGQPISADEALAVGLVDEVVASGDLLAAARRLALAIAGGTAPRRRTLQLTQRMPTSGVGFAAAVQALTDARRDLRKLRYMGQLHYELLLEAVAAGLAEGPALGLQKVSRAGRARAVLAIV